MYRFNTSSCAVHKGCGVCLKSRDPLKCGWCEDVCTTITECPLPKTWTDPTSKSPMPSCPPTISSVSFDGAGGMGVVGAFCLSYMSCCSLRVMFSGCCFFVVVQVSPPCYVCVWGGGGGGGREGEHTLLVLYGWLEFLL